MPDVAFTKDMTLEAPSTFSNEGEGYRGCQLQLLPHSYRPVEVLAIEKRLTNEKKIACSVPTETIRALSKSLHECFYHSRPGFKRRNILGIM